MSNARPNVVRKSRLAEISEAGFRTHWAAFFIAAVAIVTAPVLLGATGPLARLGVEAAIALAVVVWAISSQPRPVMALWPVAAAAVISLQLVPLPDNALSMLAPVSAAAWKISHMGLGHIWGCITVDPAATAAGIRRLVLAAAMLAVVASLDRTSTNRWMLCAALAACCIVIWALGIIFPFDKSLVLLGFINCTGPIEAEFWKTPLVPPIATNGSGNLAWVNVAGQRYSTATWIAADGFGPYIYSNHFAGAMCLTVPILLAVWHQLSKGRLPDIVRRGVAVILCAAALWTVGILATSRAGGAAILLAMLIFASLTCERPGIRRMAVTVTAAYAALLFLFTLAMYGAFTGIEKVFPLEVQPRIAALLADGRVVASRVALRMFAAAPIMGTGLSTFGELFPRFLRGDLLLNYAHNDYAQWLAETGLVGGGLLAALLATLASRFRSWMRSAPGEDRILEAGAWAALGGIGFHSFFDWNLHIPANALLAAVVMGLALASGAAAARRDRMRQAGSGPPAAGITNCGPGLLLAAACVFSFVFLARDAVSETVQRELREAIVASRLAAIDPTKPAARSALIKAIAAGERTADWDPWNAELATLIGHAHLHISTEEQPMDDASNHLAAADRWFMQARRWCAACRGLPEPIPQAKQNSSK
jgi:hypothetical protein